MWSIMIFLILISREMKLIPGEIDLQITNWSLALAVYVYSIMIALIVFRWLAIDSYRRKYGAMSPSDDSWLSSMGKKLADSGSLKFSITYAVVLIAVTLLTLGSSIVAWNSYFLSYNGPSRMPVSTLPSFPIIAVFLCSGLLYVTFTSRGLSWWDARVIIFRFYGFHRRRSYMKSEISSLFEELDVGIETYRAFLTIERLFKHEFKAGQVAREIIEQANPEMYLELESSLMEAGKPHRASRLMLASSIILLVLSILFLILGVFINSPLTRNDILADMLFTLCLVFSLMWMIRRSLELPELTPAQYMTLSQL